MPISRTKSVPRRIDRLALTIEIHSDSSLFAVDISTSLSPYGRIARRTRCSDSQRLGPFRNGRLHNRKPCFAESIASHSPSKFTAIGVSAPPTYPHPEPRLDGSLADGRRSVSQQSRAFSQQTPAHRKPCLDDAVALAHHRNAQRSECPCRGHIHIGCAATENRPFTTHRANSQQAESLRGSRAHVEAVHKRKASCSQSRENPRHPPVCPVAPNLPRARVPLRFRAGTHRQKAQRFESLRRRPVHTRAADVLHHANPIHRRNADSQGQSRGTDTTAKRARRSRAYGPSSRYARIVRT